MTYQKSIHFLRLTFHVWYSEFVTSNIHCIMHFQISYSKRWKLTFFYVVNVDVSGIHAYKHVFVVWRIVCQEIWGVQTWNLVVLDFVNYLENLCTWLSLCFPFAHHWTFIVLTYIFIVFSSFFRLEWFSYISNCKPVFGIDWEQEQWTWYKKNKKYWDIIVCMVNFLFVTFQAEHFDMSCLCSVS